MAAEAAAGGGGVVSAADANDRNGKDADVMPSVCA